MSPEALAAWLERWLPQERADDYGAHAQSERLRAIVGALAAEGLPGDLVEIGCLRGLTTVQLAGVAQQFHRRVIAIDPWEPGTQNCEGGEYEEFCAAIAPYGDWVETLRMRSDDPRVSAYLAPRPLLFAFVDGLHTYEVCTSDLRMVGHARAIAVDDTNWSAEVRRAYEEFGATRHRVWCRAFRESWLL